MPKVIRWGRENHLRAKKTTFQVLAVKFKNFNHMFTQFSIAVSRKSVTSIAFNPTNHKQFAIGSDDGAVTVFNIPQKGARTMKFDKKVLNEVYEIDWSNKNILAAVGKEKLACIFECKLLNGYNEWVGLSLIELSSNFWKSFVANSSPIRSRLDPCISPTQPIASSPLVTIRRWKCGDFPSVDRSSPTTDTPTGFEVLNSRQTTNSSLHRLRIVSWEFLMPLRVSWYTRSKMRKVSVIKLHGTKAPSSSRWRRRMDVWSCTICGHKSWFSIIGSLTMAWTRWIFTLRVTLW